mmetsp:Transcript_12299/g.16104  ORF Transcript_12299/g.16104 Transcript_12299/m.16104 type:complete len:157 (-) Transcript_12299:952-1422(-)
MTDEEIDKEVELLLDSTPIGLTGCERFKTWRVVLDDTKTSFYVGSTIKKMRRECSQFLSRKHCRNKTVFTPMVTYPDGKRIKGILEAETKFGFMWVPFFQNISMYNCTRLEWALQRKYDYLYRNGRRRLWSCSGCGSDYQVPRSLWKWLGLCYSLL